MMTSGDGATVVCSAQPQRVVSGTGTYFQGNVVAWPRARPTNGSDRGKRDLTLIVRRRTVASLRPLPESLRVDAAFLTLNDAGAVTGFHCDLPIWFLESVRRSLKDCANRWRAASHTRSHLNR